MGEYVKQNLDPNDWSGLSDEGRKLLYNTMMRHGDVPAEKDGALTEFGQAFMGAGIDTLRGVGSTLEEMYGVSGMKDYFDRVKRNNRQYDPYEGYKALSLDPANIARTIGSGAAQSALALGGAVAGGILGGGVGGVAASTGIMFGQIYGDRVQEYREAFPNQDEGTVKGLAFLSSLGESLIESVVGPEQLAAGIAKKWATGALKETTKGFVKSVGKEAVKNFLTEGSEEVAQDYWDRICRAALDERGIQLPSWEEVGETFMGGAWSGLALGAAGGAVESMGSRNAAPTPTAETPAAPVETANETPYNPESERKTKLTLAEQVAKELGINVRYVDEMKEEDKTDVDRNSEAISDGWYDENTGEIWLDRNNPNSDVLKNLGHEFKHFLDDKQKGLIQKFNDLFTAGINEAGNARAAEIEDRYQREAGQVGRGFDELSADTFGEMWTDPDFWRDVATRAEKMEAGMGQKFIDTLNEFIKIVKAKLKQIGTPEAKQLFDNMNELRDEAVNILAEIKRQNGTSTEEENVVGVNGSTEVESVPVSEIKLDPERFQFKSNTNKKTGVDENNRIGGEWDPKSAGILYLWEDKNGNKFVVNGHHRLELAKRKNVENLNAIIDREADGVTAEDARKNGILINIRDEQGEVRDYAEFVRSSKLDEATADKEGVTSRRKGKTGFTIGHYASDNLYATYRNEDITDAQAAAIADIARGDTGLENAGIRAAKNGMKKVQLVEHLKFLKANGDLRQKNEETGDLFGGFDDSALKLSEELSAKALEHIDGLKKLINSAKSAIKNPAEAKKLGVSVGKEAQNLLDRTRQELQDWENWQTNKKLRDQLLKEIKKTMPETEAAPAETKAEEPKKEAKTEETKSEKPDTGRFNPDSETPLLTTEEDANDFTLFDQTTEEAKADEKAAEQKEAEERERADQQSKRDTPELGLEEKPKKDFLDEHIIVTGVPKPANTQAVANTRPSDEEMRKELHDVIMSDGDARSKATQLSRLAKAWNMSLKEVQERCEAEVVEIAREIDSLYYMDDARKYKNIVSLYNNQPNFSNRTNTSKINQAYSTPAPLAWILGKRIGLKGNTVYEPTAGTGMLTIAGDPSTIHVNEINPLRSEILNRQGFMLNTSNDASKTRPNKKYDRVIMNPPFGEGATGTFEGFKLTKLDHVIAARALEAMKPDGRSAIIVGANTEGRNGEGRETVADHIFMNYLYSNFNVKDNFIVSGDMYTKQGASYPVRVITIEGKRAEKITPNHPKNIEKIDNWDTLYNRLQGELGNGTENNTENISEPGRSDNGSELVERPRPVSDKEGGTAADEGRVRDEGTKSSPQNRDESKPGAESVRGNGSERQDGGTGRLGENRPEQEAGGVSPNSEPGNDDSGSVRGDSSGVRGNNPELEQGNTNGSGENGGRSESSEPGGSGGQHGGQPVRNDVRPGQVRVSEPSSSWGANNTVVSTDAYEEAKKRMKDRLRRTNVGFDPGILSDGAIMAAYHIEAGARRFADFAKRMIDDLGDAIKPYLKMLYKSARDFPGMENIAKEMDSTDYVDKYNLDDLSKPETKKSEKAETKNQEQKREEKAPEQVETGEKLNDLNNKYVPASKGRNMNLVVPGFLAKETEEALNDLQKEVGDVDEFVTKELGFSSVDELYECLDDAQIDSVAMAINAIKKGTGFIIGDQTGIGKGRQCAAIMRWAKEHGRIPILFTADPKLFSDSYCNDCPDLHMSISPIVLGDDDRAKIIDSNNNTLRRPIPNRKKMDAAFDSLVKGDGEYDSVYLTYSQINRTDNAQQQHLRRLIASNKCVLILDESHMAAGSVENQRGKQGISSKSGAFFFGDHGVLFNKNVDVVYSSATFAKRPDVMPLYAAKTRLKDAARNFGEVIDAFKKGGVALQQIVSKAMARSGQYIRRERDFDGVKFESSIDSTNKEDVEERYDRVAYVLLELVKYSRVIKAAVDDIVKPDHGTSNAQEDVRVQTSSFGSVAHNYIAQLLLGSKSDIIVDNAAKAIEAGQKPVIVVNNTMGSALDTYAAENDLANGDPVTMRFADILESALMRMYTYTIPNPTGDGTIKVSFSPEDFGLGAEHEAMLSMIRELRDINLPISPIDYIKNRLAKKGIKMSELTGRERSVDYSSGTPVLAARSSKDRNKNINTNNFNSGATDGIILNQAGATGISLHSSEKYKDQRQRKMIIGQPSLDIAVVMQVLGRVLRTGQVNLPEYLILSSALSPERRVLMVLNKKLQSLNANTTANNKGAIDLGVDFLNKYGDAVVKEYVKDHPEITALLGLNITDDTQDAITKFTGKISLLPNSQQEDIYNDITDRYLILVDYLKQTGNYDLEVTVHDDWDVQTESSEELVGGNKNGVMFDQPVTRKQITIRERKKIRSADEVRGEMDKNVGRDEEEVKQKLDHRFRNVQKDIDNLMSMYQGENRKTEWIAARKALLQANYNNFRSFIEANANKVIEFKLGNDEYTGVISGYRTTGKYVPKSPFIPSATIVEFAVSDTVGKISIPFSKIIVADPSSGIFQYSDSTIPFDDVFTGKEYTTRVPRVAITGNLIKGINIAGGGKVVSYQTHEGNIEDALLLPKNADVIAKDPRREIKTADDVLAILENAGVLVAYEGATIRRNAWGGYQVAIPNSDRKGKDSKFKSDKGLEKIVLMTKVGSEWRTNWIDKDTAKRVVDYMMQNGTTFLRSQGMDESGRRYHLSEPVGAVSETDSEDTISAEANSRHFHLVEDPKLIKKLDNEDYIVTYRSVQLVNGKLYPPMAAKINGKWANEIVLGKWEESEEHPELAKPKKLKSGKIAWKFYLDKGGKKSDNIDNVDYNPYIHSSPTPLNDQFSTAFKRPNLVTIELHVPKSELFSGYHAEKANDPVGMKDWKAGIVQGKLSGTRQVMLSRWAKPVRIVPDSEVAKIIYDMIRGKVNDLPSNVLTPSLRAELEKLGVPIAEMEYSKKARYYVRVSNGRKYHLPTQVNPIREDGEIKDEYAEFLEDSEYTPKTNAELNRQAERRIAGFGGVQGVIDAVLDDDFKLNSDISQRMMQVVLNSGEFKVLDQTKRRKVADLYIKNLGTEVGRALAARRLGVLNMDDIESIQAHVNALLAKMDKETIDKLRRDVFDEFGIDIDKLPDDIVKDPRKLDEVLRKLVAQRASIPDKLYEYWINAILSSPTTHAANAIGNTANAAYELGLKRLAEATINIFMRKKDAATFGEFKEMTNAVNWGEALRRAKFMFDVETLTGSGKLDRANAAIGGKLGRAIRVPGRLLRAADEFAKAVVQPMEAAAYAYRQAKAAGMNMEATRGFILSELEDEESDANAYGRKRALDLTFQEKPYAAIQQLIGWRESGGVMGRMMKFFLPFIKTPSNILRQGIRKSPLGAANLAWQTVQGIRGKREFDNEYIQLAAEQILAWGLVMALAGMGGDDDKPFITGSSPRYGSAEQKFKANKLPPYSIRIGDNYYSYQRIEPLATGLAFIADGIEAYKAAKRGEDGQKIMRTLIAKTGRLISEKSFLDSIGTITKIAQDPEQSGMKYLTNFAASWSPNIVRHTINVFDDNVRDGKARDRGMNWFEEQFYATMNAAGLIKASPKYDYFGRPVKKDSLADSGPLWQMMRLVPIKSVSPDDNMNRAERLMWKYNMTHPGEEYYPDVPAYYFQRDRQKLYTTGKYWDEFAQKSGQLALKQINNAFKHGLLNERKPSKEDIDLIKKIFTRARKEVRDEMYQRKHYQR